MIVNDPDRHDDLYDILNNEFEDVWKTSYEYPGTWLQKKKSVFLSHAKEDRLLAEEIRQRFRQKQVGCFVADHDIEPGERWDDELLETIRSSMEFVVLATPHVTDSPWVQAELGAAWALELPITPACLGAKLPDVLQFVRMRQAVDVSTAEGKERLVNAVAKRVKKGFGNVDETRNPAS